jgi:hypothetical protein
MDDQTKWNIAVARFAAFCSNMPLSPNDDDVWEYHDIIALFEDAYGHNLSQFKIAADHMKLTSDNTMTTPLRGRWQTPHAQNGVVEYGYFRGQVRRLVDFLMTVMGGRPC